MGSASALSYAVQGTTASGAPYYKADGASYWLYWDPDCAASGYPARWIFDFTAPNTTAASDLDGDGSCKYAARINSDDSSSPPEGISTSRANCNSTWVYTDVTIQHLAPPPPALPPPTLPPPSPPPPNPLPLCMLLLAGVIFLCCVFCHSEEAAAGMTARHALVEALKAACTREVQPRFTRLEEEAPES